MIRILIIGLCFTLSACSPNENNSEKAEPNQTQEGISNVQTTEVTIDGKTVYLTNLHSPIMDRPLKELQELARQENPAAMNELSRRLMHGEGIDYDQKEAIRLLTKAAGVGNSDAQNELGGFYSHGLSGFPKDPKIAVSWFRKAAEQGDILGQFNLGDAYQSGNGVPQNDTKAFEWFNKAADQGYPDAMAQIGNFYLLGYGTSQNHDKGKALLEQAAKHHSGRACYYLGRMYYDGTGVPQDFKKAVKWFQQGTELHNAASMSHLGARYERGEGVEKNLKKATQLYLAAAKMGDVMAELNLSLCYYKGHGVPQDYQAAYRWIKQAADQNLPEAHAQLATMYIDGTGVSQDYQIAYTYAQYAAEHGDSLGIFYMGVFNEYGEVVEKNNIKAYANYRIALQLENGDPQTQQQLDRVKSQMSPAQIQQAEAEIPKLKQKYGLK